jgi:uncharacterized protein (DUF58 family)
MDEPLLQPVEAFRYASQWPWLVLLLIAAPLAVVAWRVKVHPTWWWMVLLGISLGLSLLAVFVPVLTVAVLLVDGLLAALVLVDLTILWGSTQHGITAERKVARTASLGVELPCELTIENGSPLRLRGAVRDDLPVEFDCRPSLHRLDLPARGMVTMRRSLIPGRRGAFMLEHVYLQLQSPLRLWVRQITLDVPNRLNVYPDMKQLSDYALLARTNRLSLIGVANSPSGSFSPIRASGSSSCSTAGG